MDEKNDIDQVDEIMLPGFRFHPTDEELVSFYLRRKVQERPLSIELIKQLDIYKFDPWDLPKMASIGEKEWYFYCPRDRKYRNSTRPNRVTGAGFWKATGTDRPIYSSEGTKCIGLKKSLVFYKGRAAKGIKTDWMMHEFRLPTLADSKKPLDKNVPANDSWAICRIFKKNTIAQRALSHGWAPPLVERRVDQSSSPMNSDMLSDKCIGVDSFIPREDLSTETRNSSNLSSHTGDQCCKNDHQTLQPKNAEVPMQQQASYVDSSSGLGYKMEAKSMSTNFPGSRSMSLPNLEVPMSSYFSHHVDPFSVKGTLDFVSCMLQMSPIAEFGGRSHNLVDATTANLAAPRTNLHQNVSSFQHQQTDGISADHVFLKKNVSPRPGIIPLPYPSHLYEVLKAVSWDTPTSTVEISSTNDAN